MSAAFLTHEELTELTGYKQVKGHMRWLDRYRWRYALNRYERPLVYRDYFLERMGLSRNPAAAADEAKALAAAEEPDFSALDRM